MLFATILCAFVLFGSFSSSQASNNMVIQWQRYLPGITGVSVIQTSDKGYLALGQNASLDNVSGEFTNYTSIAVKTDASGNPVWAMTYSIVDGITQTRLTYAVEAPDGYLLAGILAPVAYQFPERFCLIKIDFDGDIVWNKTYGLGVPDVSYQVGGFIPTSEGGYAMIGSFSGAAPSVAYLWFLKVDSAGNTQWNKTLTPKDTVPNPYFPPWLGGRASSLFQTNDNGYIIIGTQGSRPISPYAVAMIKLNSNGDVEWFKTYGGGGDYYHTIPTSAIIIDGGYLIAGSAAPDDSPEKGLILKSDSDGNMEWNKTYQYPSIIFTASKSNEGGFIFLGTAPETLSDSTSGRYIWAWKIDSLGNIEQQSRIKKVDNFLFSNPSPLIPASDGGYVFTGVSNMGGYNQINQQLKPDDKFWIMKISEPQPTPTPSLSPSSAWLQTALLITALAIIIVTAIAIIKWKKKPESPIIPRKGLLFSRIILFLQRN